jgi:nicotinate-nucleotide pyrophosphorylase (carboxylating)
MFSQTRAYQHVGMKRDFAQIAWDAAVEDDARQLIRLAVREDLDRQFDWTTVALVGPDTLGTANVVARKPGVVAGLPAAKLVLDEMDHRLTWRPAVEDGTAIEAGQTLATISGPARSLLAAERPLLNMLCHLSGIATLAARYVKAIAGSGAHVYDTRKTTPGWRRLEKYAARMGGARNHRTGLFDAVLIKDNHLALGTAVTVAMDSLAADSQRSSEPQPAGFPEPAFGDESFSPGRAVKMAREFLEKISAGSTVADMIVEVEVDTLAQFGDALAASPDIILLDNMSLENLRAAVALRNAANAATQLEASGGVSLETIGSIAQTGVERVSVGAITHAASWLDLGLDWR